jgi:hypothetical protein
MLDERFRSGSLVHPARRVRMKALLMSLAMGLGFFTVVAHAQAPASAPAGSTGLCKDGTYYSGDSKKGACRGHKGIKEWYAGAAATSSAGAAAPTKTKASRKSKSDDAAASTPVTASTGKPADATGLCKDGSYTTADSKKGACRGHKGVKEWYTAAAPAAAPMPAPKPSSPAPATKASAPAPAPMPAPSVAPAPTRAAPPAPETRTAAAGGGAGKVWLNTETRVYHCPNDRYYGKTKQGEYVSEADAIAQGAHGSHGKTCAQ